MKRMSKRDRGRLECGLCFMVESTPAGTAGTILALANSHRHEEILPSPLL
jgi:hypothetical protein